MEKRGTQFSQFLVSERHLDGYLQKKKELLWYMTDRTVPASEREHDKPRAKKKEKRKEEEERRRGEKKNSL